MRRDWEASKREWRNDRRNRRWDERLAAVGRLLFSNGHWIFVAVLIVLIGLTIYGKITDTTDKIKNGVVPSSTK